MNLLRRAFILAVVLLLVVVAVLSIALYIIQGRHGQIINAENRAVQRLEITDRAALQLAEQREAVASSIFISFDRRSFAQDTVTFQQLMSAPFLSYNAAGRRLQEAIIRGQRQFSQAALLLPAHPTAAEVLPIHNMGDALAVELRSYRYRHTVDLAALQTSEKQQNAAKFAHDYRD